MLIEHPVLSSGPVLGLVGAMSTVPKLAVDDMLHTAEERGVTNAPWPFGNGLRRSLRASQA